MSSPAQLSALVGHWVILLCGITMAFYASRILVGLLLGALVRLPLLHTHGAAREAAARAALRVMPSLLRGGLATALTIGAGAAGAGGASATTVGLASQAAAGVGMNTIPTLDRLPVWNPAPEQKPTAATQPQRPAGHGDTGREQGREHVEAPNQDVSEGSRQSVTVHMGDSLWSIAREHLGPRATDRAVAAEWPRWWKANRGVIGDDPSLIQPGQVLVAPDRAAGK